jgi:hypothetical protein
MKIAQLKQNKNRNFRFKSLKQKKEIRNPNRRSNQKGERNDEETCLRKASHEEVVVTSIADLSQNSIQFPSLLFNDDRK